MGCWVIAHECGHHAFHPNRRVEAVVGFVLHSLLLVPYEFAEKPPESPRFSHQRELVELMCAFQRLRPPACTHFGALVLS